MGAFHQKDDPTVAKLEGEPKLQGEGVVSGSRRGGQDGGTGHGRQWTVKDARKGPSRIRGRVRAGAISSYLHCG